MEATPYVYFWPSYAFFPMCSAIFLIYTNLTLYVVSIILYYLVPSDIMDNFIIKWVTCIKSYFSVGIAKVEKNISKTFKIKVLYPIPEKSLNIWHPHALLAITPGIHNVYRITKKYKPTKFAVANIFHMFPFVRDWMRIVNTISTDYDIMKKTLETESLSIVLGGAKEMNQSNGKHLKLVIKERTGIFKLALETGTPLVPILTYGETELFPSSFSSFNEFLYDMWKISIPIPTLTSIQNWFELWNGPLQTIQSYTGKPISVEKQEPTDKKIRILRKKYIKNVLELFKKTNPGGYTLEII